ncbi:MAG: NAD(P)H-binding protein [Actinomycetota bacterium]|nr:NAD(P)H-binding protein [Actinomycetota bacterium]
MPAIVVGADTEPGLAIIDALIEPNREVRAFVSDPESVADLKSRAVKVALGDVSDDSHVEAAALHCFTAVLVSEAARDGRERSFASSEREVLAVWARAVANAGVHRVIWAYEGEPPPVDVPEVAQVSPKDPDLGRKVAELDDAVVIN